ncbi:MAG TPA: hypothetical protein VFC19_53925 [Candidatus Limnocylindrales bacterium]|nr:hypothetical protein [Candidatus Limnocylindrales bacterium]
MLRVGPHAGTPLEDYGLLPNEHHRITRNDVLHGETDLMAKVAQMLGRGKPRRFDVELSAADGQLTASFTTLGVDRADVVVDGQPRLTVDLDDNPGPISVPLQATPNVVQVVGFDAGTRVALRTFVNQGSGLRLRTTLEA